MDIIVASALSASIGFCLLVISGCAISLRKRNKLKCLDTNKIKKRLKLCLTGAPSNEAKRLKNTFAQCHKRKDGKRCVTSIPPYFPLGTITEHHQQIDCEENTKNCDNLKGHIKSDNNAPGIIVYDESETQPTELRRQLRNIRSKSCESPDTKIIPKLKFGISYKAKEHKLITCVYKVNNLPQKYEHNCSVYLRVNLLPKNAVNLKSKYIHETSNPEFDETFEFEEFYKEDIEKCSLRFVVYVKEASRTRDTFVGEVFCLLSQLNCLSEEVKTYTQELKPSRIKKKSTSDRLLYQFLGQLFVHLQYQPFAQRMKVVVRRAENMPRGGQLAVVQPDHYVVINLFKNDKIVCSKMTRCQNSFSPVWNEAFLFDLPDDRNLNEYALDFVVMKGKLYKKDGVIGHILIGSKSAKSGIAHWEEALKPRALETAKWHDITPMIIYQE